MQHKIKQKKNKQKLNRVEPITYISQQNIDQKNAECSNLICKKIRLTKFLILSVVFFCIFVFVFHSFSFWLDPIFIIIFLCWYVFQSVILKLINDYATRYNVWKYITYARYDKHREMININTTCSNFITRLLQTLISVDRQFWSTVPACIAQSERDNRAQWNPPSRTRAQGYGGDRMEAGSSGMRPFLTLGVLDHNGDNDDCNTLWIALWTLIHPYNNLNCKC